MTPPTRTFGPLHFEDLEPHRFEDLVRQLIYDFKNWRQLEATGRAGADESFDVRGWEIMGDELSADTVEPENSEGMEPTTLAEADRLWLIQCKRERTIGPTKLMKYLDAIPGSDRPTIPAHSGLP